MDVVEAPANIQLCEVLGAMELSDQLGNQWKWVFVFDSDRIESSVVLDEAEGSILLFDKEDWRCHRRLGQPDVSGVQGFLEEDI